MHSKIWILPKKTSAIEEFPHYFQELFFWDLRCYLGIKFKGIEPVLATFWESEG